MFAALAGLAAGAFHVLAGPDHLAAVAPMAAGTDRPAWRAGFAWGVGHSAGVLLVGALLVSVRALLPIDALSAWSERLVGVALVAVGVWGLWQARAAHGHAHVSGAPSFAMGTLHGLAGSAHVYGVLPSLAFASPGDAAAYLAGFGVGAVTAMTAFATMIGALSVAAGTSGALVRRRVLYAASIVAVIVGGTWLFT